jgi:tRNA threonylcarbamoyladenosine biosynthesis protein TsaE
MQHLHLANSLEDLRRLAGEIALQLKKYPIVILKGELGAGKTTLAQMICEQLGVKESVTSPTYTLVNEYQFGSGKIYHFDLYRLGQEEELEGIGFMEYLDSCLPIGKTGNICLIEWPEIAGNYLQDFPIMEVVIHKENDSRSIELNHHTITA